MTTEIAHLIAFLASLAALVVIIVTGHGSDPTLTAVLSGVLGGSGATTAANVLGGLFGRTTAPQPPKQSGHARLLLLVAMSAVALVACATLHQTSAEKQQANVETACATAATAIQTLAVVQETHPLSADAQKMVGDVMETLSPVCTAATPQDYDAVKWAAINAAVNEISAEAAKDAPAAVPQ